MIQSAILFPFRTSSFKGESLSSYIIRLAEMNRVSPIDLLNLFSYKKISSNSHLIDIIPQKYIRVNELCSAVGHNNLARMSLLTVLLKVGIEEENILSWKKHLYGLVDHALKYCPLCLRHERYYKLIWQLKEISICRYHGIYLMNSCPHCGSTIHILSYNSLIGTCDNCQGYLYDGEVIKAPIPQIYNNNRLWNDWEYLLDPDCQSLISETIHQNIFDLAVKIIYTYDLLYNIKNISKTNSNKPALFRYYLQLICGIYMSKVKITLSTILSILRELDISLVDFAKMEVPKDYMCYFNNFRHMLK